MSNTYLLPGTGADGTQLWVLTVNDDGTASSKELVNLSPGDPSAGFFQYGSGATIPSAPQFTAFNNGFLFVANGVVNESDNTAADYYIPSAGGAPTGFELWYTDKTASGTHLVADTFAGTFSAFDGSAQGNNGSPAQITPLGNGTAMFSAVTDSVGKVSLFETSGGIASATQITYENLYNPSYITRIGNEALFTALTPATAGIANYLFASDGTDAGTRQLTHDQTTFLGTAITAAGAQEVLFADSSGLNSTNGTDITSLTTDFASSVPSLALNSSQSLVIGTTKSGNLDLFSTDGTAPNTHDLKTLISGSNTSASFLAALIGASGVHNELIATQKVVDGSTNTSSYQLWITDGTAAGTTFVATSSQPLFGATAGSHFFFAATDAGGVTTLNATDENGHVTQLTTDAASSHAGPAGDAVFVDGGQLFVSDGTKAGTHGVTTGLSYFGDFTPVGNNLLFSASNGSTYGIWDVGTTGKAAQINLNGDVSPTAVTAVGSEVFFNAVRPDGSTESWITDGTQAGTHVVQGAGFVIAGSNGTSFTTPPPPCFLAGTPILTARGEVPVQDLVVGDLVLTLSGQGNPLQPILWIGRSAFDARRHPRPDQVTPIRFAAGSLGDGLPHSDLLVSPGHAMLIDGVLMQAERLVNGATITRDSGIARGEYFHIEVAQHDILLSAGVPSESFLDTGNRGHFNNAADIVDLHPDFSPKHWTETCRPLVQDGPVLAAAKARLLQRAHAAGFVARADHGLHVVADGRIVEGEPCGEKAYCFTIPAGCAEIVLASRVWVPSELQPASTDMRRLGVFVQRMVADGRVVALDDAALSGGWHALERDGAATRRWTSGRAALPAGVTNLVIELFSRPHYWQHEAAAAVRKPAARRAR